MGSHGDDVRAWQERLLALGYRPGKADGIFGARTDTATRVFQSEHGLRVDGVVGANTLKAAEGAPPRGTGTPDPSRPPECDRFVQATHYTAADGRTIGLLVLHSTENDIKAGVADAVARMFAQGDREASAHYVVGPDEVIGCVREKDVAWAAPGANHDGIQIEMVGWAKYTASDWAGADQQKMIARAVQLAAGICHRHNIPVRVVDADGLLRGERGITTHANVSKAFKKSAHWDPGPAFPLDDILARVIVAVAGAPGSDKA
jgi:N-acetyl-anhydromuramyl-L-alanine amidase AmpD